MRVITIKYYDLFLDKLSHNKENIHPIFVNFISILITNSITDYNTIMNSIFKNPIIDENIEYQPEEFTIIQRKTNYFIAIVTKLLIITNSCITKNIFAYLIKLSLSKRILYNKNKEINKKCKTISLISFLLKYINITPKGQNFFSSSLPNKGICYRRQNNTEKKDIYYYIDIDSILSNFIYHIGLYSNYPNNQEYFEHYDHYWNSFTII